MPHAIPKLDAITATTGVIKATTSESNNETIDPATPLEVPVSLVVAGPRFCSV